MIMRKNYYKEAFLILLGLILGYLYHKHTNPLPINTTVVVRDTIPKHDTIYAKAVVLPLNRKNVMLELKKQKIPHANIVLKQSLLETGNYTSKVCKVHNNIFGIRKGKKYKKYNNYIECITDYKKLISSRYKGGDYFRFLEKIRYAEDPNYTDVLKTMV